MTNGVLKVICELSKLERLTLVQNRFNDLGTGRLSKLENLRVLDLRGNMEAGDMTMEIVGSVAETGGVETSQHDGHRFRHGVPGREQDARSRC